MSNTLGKPPVVRAEMLIRRPVQEVFRAFVDPEVTSKFWFTKGSGKLESGAKVRWDWEMYGVGADIDVLAVEQNSRIVIDWGTRVEWTFVARGESETFVTIVNDGFEGTADELLEQAMDSTQGFTFVLSGLKAYLEHGIQLNLVADKSPDANIIND
ncbi:SRPBCC family protein [Paenibacillus sp. PAMC21692]|uniref:SRPBCC family protein n=1 Tax=Paenibacillus sp. PAMC21692 TaxID=2762320 RepID=UPI00164D32C0|nr:SRPBCC family protein [Paenibacillus sp. PAMC21692]QNK57758.1 SRPBCC family protein [Paenibacillus sp. PAMC21692]